MYKTKGKYMDDSKFSSLIGSVKYIVNDYNNLSNSQRKQFNENILEIYKEYPLIKVEKERKTFKVEEIKKYDVLYYSGNCNIPHYNIVFKVYNGYVYSLNITSDIKYYSPYKIENSRIFKDSYICRYINIIPLEEAKNYFCLVFDSKKEFDNILKLVKEEYLSILK